MPRVGRTAACFCISLFFSACGRKPVPSPSTKTKTTASSSAPSTSASPASASPSASASPAQESAEEQAVSSAVYEWNDALDRHDTEKLARLYAAEVRFYGRTLSKEAVVAAKRKAFEKQPSFRQEIVGPITVNPAGHGNRSASFQKRSGADDKVREVAATLVLSRGDAGAFLVVEEADETTAPAATTTIGEGCQATAAEVVNALPAVKRAIDDLQAQADKSDGRANFGGIGPNDDGEGGFSASYGLQTAARYEMQIVYRVDAKGRLSVSLPSGELSVPPKVLAEVERACRR